jgi:hypothetical protein
MKLQWSRGVGFKSTYFIVCPLRCITFAVLPATILLSTEYLNAVYARCNLTSTRMLWRLQQQAATDGWSGSKSGQPQ